MSCCKKTGNKIKDLYYLIFKYPSETELKLQQEEAERGEANLSFKSYIGLKNFHKKLKYFLVGFFSTTVAAIAAAFVVLVLLLNFIYYFFGLSGNPVDLKKLLPFLHHLF